MLICIYVCRSVCNYVRMCVHVYIDNRYSLLVNSDIITPLNHSLTIGSCELKTLAQGFKSENGASENRAWIVRVESSLYTTKYRLHVVTYVPTYVRMYVCMYVCIYVMYVRTYVCMYVCLYNICM